MNRPAASPDRRRGALRPLLRDPQLAPLLVTQAAGAFNDNLVKNALVVLAVFGAAHRGPAMSALAGALFIAPYGLLSATAGAIADRYEKALVIRVAKLAEVVLMALAALGFIIGSLPTLLAVLFGLGVQAALFGPVKYAFVPERLAATDIVGANGLLEAMTFLAILAGTLGGSLLIGVGHGAALVAATGFCCALLGAASAFRVPVGTAAAPDAPVGVDPVRETIATVRTVRGELGLWRAVLGLSWFWALGGAIVAEFPNVVRDQLGGGAGVVALFLAVFSVGTGLGSISCARLLRGEVTPRFVPFASLGITLFLADFALGAMGHGGAVGSVGAVLRSWRGERMLADLLGLAGCGGLFSVPLYAMLQERSPAGRRARTIAANNVVNAGAMLLAAVAIAVLVRVGLSAAATLLVFAAANGVVVLLIVCILPQEVWRTAFRVFFTTLHGVELRGLEHYRAAGPCAVIVSNHLSYADAALIASFLPDNPTFAIDSTMAKRPWVRPFLAAVDVFPVDMANPLSLRRMIEAVRDEGRKLMIFPEGRLTKTGALMKIHPGAGVVADKAGAVVVPVVIDGPQYTHFGRMQGKLRLRWFPPLSITIMPPERLVPENAGELTPRARRELAGRRLHDVLVEASFRARHIDRTLFAALLDASALHGRRTPVLEDVNRRPLSYGKLVLASVVLGRALRRVTPPTGESHRLALMLPNSVGAVASFFGLQAFGITPCMLNFSAGAEAMLSACRTASIAAVVTSRAFVERGKLGGAVEHLETAGIRVVWLEDVRAGLTWRDKLRGTLDAINARRLPGAAADPVATEAAVLFTSGSEGAPKGVVHSHRSLLANCAQLAAVVDFNGADRVFNAMPCFHSFGLTGGTLLPLLYGVRSFQYPSPLHYRVVPALIYDTDATICFGTDTFLNGWARHANPYDFYAMRYVFGGAERIAETTRRLFADRFGVRLLEGYGATETAPVIAINTSMHNRPGSVGRVLPGIACRLEAVDGIADAGRLHVSGPNLMRGYLLPNDPGVLAPCGAEYDTGDVVTLDAEGFLHIRARARRFAKIAGEMVSMVAAEEFVSACWPVDRHAVLAVPDRRRGEALLLVTTRPDADTRELLASARARGTSDLVVPRTTMFVSELPLLGTGKVDYPALQRLARERSAAIPSNETAPAMEEEAEEV